jgi:hypothetical protein
MSEPPFGHLEIEFACIGSYKFYITDITVAGEPIKVEESSSQEPQKEITEQTPSSPTQQEESIIQTTSEKTIFDYLSTADILYIGLGISIVLVVFYRFYFKDDPIEAKSVQLPKKPESTHLPINYDNEEILLSLERGWHAIRHGEKYEWSKSAFRFDLARKTILTNKRILFLKNEKIDSIINLSDINEIYPDVQATGNPYIRIQFKDGTGASIFFILLGLQMYLGIWYMAGKQKALTDRCN